MGSSVRSTLTLYNRTRNIIFNSYHFIRLKFLLSDLIKQENNSQKLKQKKPIDHKMILGICLITSIVLVPVKGLEPPLPCEKRILSPSRLPFRHTGLYFIKL